MRRYKFNIFAFLVLAVISLVATTGWALEGDSNFTNVVASGNVAFQTTLLANGRAGGASTVASSSTNLAPSSLPFSVIYKHVGGPGSVDGVGVGTVLPDGKAGQVITFIITGLQSTGTWVLTPSRKTGFDDIVFDTVNDSASLMYYDDTTGWIVVGASGVSVRNRQSA